MALGAIALALVSGAGWYFASPGYALMQLRDAAIQGDETELEERIDFPKVRDNLKTEFRAQMTQQLAKETDGFAQLGGMMAMGMVDGMVDGFVNADTMGNMVREGQLKKQDGEPAGQSLEWNIQRRGFDRFTARPKGQAIGDSPALQFERDGFGWRLVEIDLPDKLMEQGAAAGR